jgi:hypothetical protein
MKATRSRKEVNQMGGYSQDDFELQAYADRFAAAIDAGEIQVPGPEEAGSQQGARFTLAATDDPAVVRLDEFTKHGALDVREPDAVLAAMAETAAADRQALAGLSDDALLGLVGAGRRMEARAAAIQQRAIAEYARRQRQPVKSRAGKGGYNQFAQDDLAPELVLNSNQAEDRMIRCEAAEARLPQCSQLLWGGKIGEYQMKIIGDYTACLDDAGAAEADEIIASAAPGLTSGKLRGLAARVALMIDPEAAKDRRKEAVKKARVEKFREIAGTAALCGRDLSAQSVLRSWGHIDARARQLRADGAQGTLAQLRVAVYLGLTSGLDPLAVLSEVLADADPRDGDQQDADTPVASANQKQDPWPWDEPDEAGEDPQDGEGGSRRGPQPPKGPQGRAGKDAPVPALINLLVPLGTLFNWSSTPGEIPGMGPLDPEDLQDLVQAASTDPRTRWCVTIIDPKTKEALAHGCAPGQHRWHPSLYRTGGGDRDGPFPAPDADTVPGRDDRQQAAAEFIASLRVKLASIAKGSCDHAHCTDKYVIPRTLKHLIKARKATCIAPGCNRPAAEGDADHTIPWPEGLSCECNLGAPCRYHHRNKQADGWELTQPEPGVFHWKGPSGRVRITTSSRYLI